MTTHREYLVEDSGERLDQFLAARLEEHSRSYIQRLIADGLVLLNGRTAKAATRLNPGDTISVSVPEPEPLRLAPEEIPLTIVYQDDDLVVVDKPAGLVVHPAPGHTTGTLVNAILAQVPDLVGIQGTLRPGIVHRLDKDTSGLMVVAKNDRAQKSLSEQMRNRQVRKQYLALVQGHLSPAQGIIEAPIGRDPSHRKRMAVTPSGREARTEYRVLEYPGNCSLLLVTLWTGRTHQIRVHMAAIGHPVVGDLVYGAASPFFRRQFLHAHRLGFRLPSTGEYREFESPLPPDLQHGLEVLRASP
jgi:23S rRNA pseudouridine1911/1915/1917 synthase